MVLRNYKNDCIHQRLSWKFFTWRELFNRTFKIAGPCVRIMIVQSSQRIIWNLINLDIQNLFLASFWLELLHEGIKWQLFIGRRVFKMKFDGIRESNRVFMMGWKSRKKLLLWIFSQFSNLLQSKALRLSISNKVLIKKFLFGPIFFRKSSVKCSINHFCT